MERVTHKFAHHNEIMIGGRADLLLMNEGERFLDFYRNRWQVGVTVAPIFEGIICRGKYQTFFDVTFFGDTKGGLSADMQAEEFAREGGYIKITQ